jgi:hypothetical protein
MPQGPTSNDRWYAEIPAHARRDGLLWLVIERDPDNSNAYFLFEQETLSGPCKYDTWHETFEAAQRQAQWRWGVAPEQWRRT